ncbi:family 32 glycosyltransferase [Dactylonectria estremocensis]|uniref:Family 32 glycosyltransferase n=1 Tax=Dactylonectria estremocensis TaxID=1079267 RepID=A0A9P9ESJ6_9HYPO|nr:family 32 glycosyltransferase [Dactylonectria estremocensis]
MCLPPLRLGRVGLYLLIADLIILGLLVYSLQPLITLLVRNEELFAPRPLEEWNQETQHPIPMILHQTTADEVIPDKWVQSQKNCKETYPNFEYKLWTDASARAFLAAEYSWFLDTWDNYHFPIQRADSIRYFVLHQYGGIYLDMDTYCNATFPVQAIQPGAAMHAAVFKSTLPTGVTNDFMVSSAKHPAFAAAIAKLPLFYKITWLWARLQPYSAIMLSSGPLFISLALEDYLLQQPSLPSMTVQVVHQSKLAPYITDLQSATWHQTDARVLMWLGLRPWTWFSLGAIGFVTGVWIVNYGLVMVYKLVIHQSVTISERLKVAKVL